MVPIDAHVVKDDLRTKIELYWGKKGGALKLVDVAFDGDSLIKDYQNQFARIVDKEGVSGADEEGGREARRAGQGRARQGTPPRNERVAATWAAAAAGDRRWPRAGGGVRHRSGPRKLTADEAVDIALRTSGQITEAEGKVRGVGGPAARGAVGVLSEADGRGVHRPDVQGEGLGRPAQPAPTSTATGTTGARTCTSRRCWPSRSSPSAGRRPASAPPAPGWRWSARA